MIKRLLGILLLALYLPAAAGVGFSSHFCFGKLKETKVFSVEKQSCCCDEAEEEETGCCRNEIKFIKLDKDQITSSSKIQLKAKVFTLASLINFKGLHKLSLTRVYTPMAKEFSPPLPVRNLLIQHRSLLIWFTIDLF